MKADDPRVEVAREAARAVLRDAEWNGLLDDQANARGEVQQLGKMIAGGDEPTAEKAAAVLAKLAARGSGAAQDAIAEIIGDSGTPLPDALRNYAAAALRDKRPGRKTQPRHIWQDRAIREAVQAAVAAGLDVASSNRATRGGTSSACKVVADVLREFGVKRDEGAVTKVWERRRR